MVILTYARLTECMKLFSQGALRKYLGENLIEQMITEWEHHGPVTKKSLVEMIIQLNGIEILKSSDFRKDVLLHLQEKEIEEIFDLLPSAKKKNCNSLDKKVNDIASLSWRSSDANIKFLQILGVDPSVLVNQSETESVVITHQANKRY